MKERNQADQGEGSKEYECPEQAGQARPYKPRSAVLHRRTQRSLNATAQLVTLTGRISEIAFLKRCLEGGETKKACRLTVAMQKVI